MLCFIGTASLPLAEYDMRIHVFRDFVTDTGSIIRMSRSQWSNSDGHGWIKPVLKHNNKTHTKQVVCYICIILWLRSLLGVDRSALAFDRFIPLSRDSSLLAFLLRELYNKTHLTHSWELATHTQPRLIPHPIMELGNCLTSDGVELKMLCYNCH